jgi:hypothetical protein
VQLGGGFFYEITIGRPAKLAEIVNELIIYP